MMSLVSLKSFHKSKVSLVLTPSDMQGATVLLHINRLFYTFKYTSVKGVLKTLLCTCHKQCKNFLCMVLCILHVT